MGRMIGYFLVCVSFAASTAVAQMGAVNFTTASGVESGQAYDILGLKLGMTAAEAEKVLYPTTHVMPPKANGALWSPNGYSMYSNPRQFGAKGFFVSGLSINRPGMNIILNFTEVAPGEAPAPEMLYIITYAPALSTDADRTAFQARLLAKYGQPSADMNQLRWCRKKFDSDMAYGLSGLAVLQYTTYNGNLTLSNGELSRHMQKIHESRGTGAAPPL